MGQNFPRLVVLLMLQLHSTSTSLKKPGQLTLLMLIFCNIGKIYQSQNEVLSLNHELLRVLEWGAIAFSASQVHMEYSTGQTTSWVTNQISVNLRKQIISSVFSDHNAVRLGINYRGKNVRNTNTWRLNNTLLNNQQVTEEIKR